MLETKNVSKVLLVAVAAWSLLGCDEEKSPPAKPTASAPRPQPTLSVPEPKPSAPAASAAPAPPHPDCPEGSTGEGTLGKPCEGKGAARMMEVTWNGKISDTGPSFRVKNTAKRDILYGKVVVYFYDKAGKQLEVPGAGADAKPRPSQPCSGNIFDGPMKAGEKAVITFSCVKKDHVPEGTTAIEAEMEIVGFADASAKKSEFYWRNKELSPDARPKSKKK